MAGANRKSTRPPHNHPASATVLFQAWVSANYDHPYPDSSVKAELAARTGEHLPTSCVAATCAVSCVRDPASRALTTRTATLRLRTEGRASCLVVCECAQTRVEACDARERDEICKTKTSQGDSSAAARTSWNCAAESCLRGSCGAWGLAWPVRRTAQCGCATDEPRYSRSRAGCSSAFADVPAPFERGAASPRAGARGVTLS